jgi:ribosomal protein L22
MKYAIVSGRKASASSTLNISHKDAAKFCRVINRKKFSYAKKTLDDISKKIVTLDGKTYKSINDEMIRMLKEVENNARKKGLDPDNMFIFISTHKGPTMHRNRRRWRKFGSKMKTCHVQLVLSDNDGFGKKVRERGNKE